MKVTSKGEIERDQSPFAFCFEPQHSWGKLLHNIRYRQWIFTMNFTTQIVGTALFGPPTEATWNMLRLRLSWWMSDYPISLSCEQIRPSGCPSLAVVSNYVGVFVLCRETCLFLGCCCLVCWFGLFSCDVFRTMICVFLVSITHSCTQLLQQQTQQKLTSSACGAMLLCGQAASELIEWTHPLWTCGPPGSLRAHSVGSL